MNPPTPATRWRRGAWTAALLWAACPAAAGVLPGARLALEVLEPGAGRVPEAAPWRFVLLEDRTVFVGGSDRVVTARLDKRDVKEIEKLADRVRKARWAGEVRLGPGETRYRLVLERGAVRIEAVGDPARASGNLRSLGALLERACGFYHPALATYRPTQYALRARAESLEGGCREDWPFGEPVSAAAVRARPVPASTVRDWPVGAFPASVCSAGRRWTVTLRPLLPGEGLD